MKKKNCYFALWAALFLVFVMFRFAGNAYSQLADSPWPMFGHDAQHTGRSPYVGPSQPNLAWERGVSNNKPIIGKNGCIYTYNSQDGYFVLRLDGTVADTGDVARVQVVTRDNSIYFNRGSTFYALNPDGSQKWNLSVGGGATPGNVVLDEQGDIFLDDGYNLSSIDPGGILIWQVPLTADESGAFPKRMICHPAIDHNGTIYIVDYDGLKAYTQEGNLKWNFDIWPASDCRNSITIGDDGTIYLGRRVTFTSYPLLYAINPDGTKKWEVNIDNLGIGTKIYGIFSPCAIGTDSTIYFGLSTGWNDDGYLCAVEPDGSLKWTFEAWKGFPGSPICDASGKVYAASGHGELYCFDLSGSLLWEYTIDHPYGELDSYSYPAIDSLGTLYVVAGGYSGRKLCTFFNIDPSQTPDLSIIADSITFEPSSGVAVAGTKVKIKVPIKEIDCTQSAAFDVIFYADNFSNQIDSVRAYAPADFKTYVEGTWETEGLKTKTYQIFIEVKNANPAESNISNNQAQATFTLLPSLQERIDLAQVGDTVWVTPGTYFENLTLKKGVVVKSTHGPERTIIDGRGLNSVIKALHLDPTAVIEGFTLTNGYQTSFGGGGVYIERGGVTIRNNIICGNDASNGGAIWMIGSFVESDPVIENNLIIDNHASFDGGAVYANNSWALFRNNTVLNNSSSFSYMTGGIHTVGYFSPTAGIVNCIIWGNGINLGGTASAIYSCIEDSNSGSGNIFFDPMFVDPANSDYSLQEDSPCIDIGDPAGLRDPDGTRADLGWKYYDQSATIARIIGRLTDAATGVPVTMAKIYLSGSRNDLVPPDANGSYVFAVPSDTGYTVSVFAPNHSTAKKENLSTTIGEATVVNFSLESYPTQITLYPPTKLEGMLANNAVHLTWQLPNNELAFDDGFYEQSVGFQNSQGVLAAGSFDPQNYPAKIDTVKVAFDGERAGDKFELLIYLDDSGTATAPNSSMLVYSQPNIPIEVGGGFQKIDISGEGITLNNGNFFIGVKQQNSKPMYMLLDNSSNDGHAFVDDNLDGSFDNLTSFNIHGSLAIRSVISLPNANNLTLLKSRRVPLIVNSAANDSLRQLALQRNQPVGLISKTIINSNNLKNCFKQPDDSCSVTSAPQSLYVYRSEISPVTISNENKIATLSANSTYFDDVTISNDGSFYYIVGARYTTGDIISSEELLINFSTGVEKDENDKIPTIYKLTQNYPNPFNPETTINYQIPHEAEVTLKVFNVAGQLVNSLQENEQPAGVYSIIWSGTDLLGNNVPSGVYFYQISAIEISSGKSFVETRKMVLVR